ncbi:MAG TPA: peptide ABC transporter substrate-binding protein [Gemmatimonadaceae bacterium]|nr:peptide ABC transporter substrate-binding protein [Gemmatimonadaceae bacterium]
MHALNLRGLMRVSTLVGLVGASLACGSCTAPRPANVAVYASGTDLESGNPLVTVHPLSRQIQRYALFVTLARYDSALAPAPYYARRWEWSPDHRTLTFHLASGLRWHDGVPTTARDVAYTIDAARDPATGFFRASDLAIVRRVDAVDDSTVSVEFTRPQTEFPLVLCELPIVPAHLLARIPHDALGRAPFNLHPVGNGPFEFVDRRAGARWTFARNPAFPASLGGPPRLDGIVVTVVDEPTTKFAGLASGELDVAGIAPTMASLAGRDPSIRVVSYPVLFTTGLVFNVHKPPFDDVRVRRAISLSIDRDRIVRAALAGYGTPAAGPVPPESPLSLGGAPAHDTARADSLLDAAGWRRGADGVRRRGTTPFTFELSTVGSGDNALEQLVQADLAARGIRMRIRQVELGTFLTEARASRKTFDALVTGIPGDVTLSHLGAMFESRQRGGTLDYADFHTRRLDSLFASTRTAASDSARAAAWKNVQRELATDVPVAWIYHSRGVQGVSSRLKNVVMDLRGEMVSVARWRIAGDSSVAVAAR